VNQHKQLAILICTAVNNRRHLCITVTVCTPASKKCLNVLLHVSHNKPQHKIFLYTKLKCLFVRFVRFLCLYLIQIQFSKAISIKYRTRFPFGLQEIVGYVWNHNTPPCRPFRPLYSRAVFAYWCRI